MPEVTQLERGRAGVCSPCVLVGNACPFHPTWRLPPRPEATCPLLPFFHRPSSFALLVCSVASAILPVTRASSLPEPVPVQGVMGWAMGMQCQVEKYCYLRYLEGTFVRYVCWQRALYICMYMCVRVYIYLYRGKLTLYHKHNLFIIINSVISVLTSLCFSLQLWFHLHIVPFLYSAHPCHL